MIKLIRKRIDVDGLTKVSDQITSRMLQKERAYKQQIETLNEHMRRMQRFVYALIHINNSQVNLKTSSLSLTQMTLSRFLAHSSTNGNNIPE